MPTSRGEELKRFLAYMRRREEEWKDDGIDIASVLVRNTNSL